MKRIYKILGESTTASPENKISRTDASYPDKYEYTIGVNLAQALSERSLIFAGVIQGVKSSEGDKQLKIVEFLVDDWIVGKRDTTGNSLQLTFNIAVNIKAGPDENSYEGVKLVSGQRLIVGGDLSTNSFRFVLSDEAYFSTIKDVVRYDSLGFADDTSDRILERLSSERNFVLAGYIVQRFYVTGTAGDVNERAKVLAELLDNTNSPKWIWGRILGELSEYLAADNLLMPIVRDRIVQKMVEIATKKDDYAAEQAILLLVHLSNREKINLAMLGKENSAKLS